VVIDNASFDGCDEIVRQLFPYVRFMQSEQNLGFAKANNAALQVSRGRNILFLNPDTELEGLAVETLYDTLNSLPDAGIVGPKLLNTDRSVQTNCIRVFPTILNQVLDSNALRSSFPGSRLCGIAPLFAGNEVPTEVDAVSGACLMVKRSVFESIGKFSTEYFMYSEDIDLCFKVREASWKTYYVPTAVVVHHGGASVSQNNISTFSSVMMLESRWRFFRKTRSFGYCLLYRVAMCFSSFIRVVVVLLVWPTYIMRGEGPSHKNVFNKWTARFRWTFGGEKWVKNY